MCVGMLALKWFLSWMCCHVCFQIYCWWKRLWTLFACECLLSRMNSHMSFQTSRYGTGMRTLFTRKGFFARMSSHMNFLIPRYRTRIRTLFASKCSLFWMYFNVSLQIYRYIVYKKTASLQNEFSYEFLDFQVQNRNKSILYKQMVFLQNVSSCISLHCQM